MTVREKNIIRAIRATIKGIEKMGLDSTINLGGCGFFASLLAQELEFIGEPFKVVYLDRELNTFDNEDEIENNVANLSFNVTVNHIMIYWNGYYIDGTHFSKKLPKKQLNKKGRWYCNLRGEDMYKAYERVKYEWNPAFDPDRIPDLQGLLSFEFNRLAS